MSNNRTFALNTGCGSFTGKFDGTQSPFTQGANSRMPSKYSAAEQEWCPHRQEKIDGPVIEFFLHETQNL